MKKVLIAALLVLCFSISSNAQYGNTAIQVGQKAPELEFKNTDGKLIKLSKINKKRIILIDFWASWCGPCRKSSPALTKLYQDYKGKKFKGAKKGFTVLSVSMDTDSAAWVKAILDDKYVWSYHMSDLKGWASEPAKLYGIAFIPQCFLVDETGMIIGKYNRIEQAEEDLKKLLK
jgi:thiol-disulfide isomerase/thioredoxin